MIMSRPLSRKAWIVTVVYVVSGALLTIPHLSSAKDGWEVIVCNPLLRQLQLESTWAAAKAIGVGALEIAVDPDLKCYRLYVGKKTPYSLDSLQNALKVAGDAKHHGLRTPVICFPVRLGSKVSDQEYITKAKKLIDVAPVIGCEHIYLPMTASRSKASPMTDEEFTGRAIKILQNVTDYAAGKRVEISIENLSLYLNRAKILRAIFDKVPENRLGLTLDPINLYWYGYPRSKVYEIVQAFAARVRYFHAKNGAYPKELIEKQRTPGYEYGRYSVPVAKGDLDFKRILKMVSKAGYRGYVSIEDDSLPHFQTAKRVEVLKDDVRSLRRIVAELRNE